MTHDEIVALLQLVAAGDGRKIDPAVVAVWRSAADHARWTYPEAVAAVEQHFSFRTEWLMPAHVTERIRAARNLHATPEERRALNGPAPDWGAGQPVEAAYDVAGAVERECPSCAAQPLEPCTNRHTHMTRKIPCTARLTGRPTIGTMPR